jgi:hypothetical protein
MDVVYGDARALPGWLQAGGLWCDGCMAGRRRRPIVRGLRRLRLLPGASASATAMDDSAERQDSGSGSSS